MNDQPWTQNLILLFSSSPYHHFHKGKGQEEAKTKWKYIRHNANCSWAQRAKQHCHVPSVQSAAWIPDAAQQKQPQQFPGRRGAVSVMLGPVLTAAKSCKVYFLERLPHSPGSRWFCLIKAISFKRNEGKDRWAALLPISLSCPAPVLNN